MKGLLIVFGGFVGSIGLMVWAVVDDFRRAEAKEKAKRKLLEQKLEEEKLMPMCFIEFELPSGAIERTEPIEPMILMESVLNSEERAKRVLRAFYYDKNYFRDVSGMTYPACNVMKAYIKEEI